MQGLRCAPGGGRGRETGNRARKLITVYRIAAYLPIGETRQDGIPEYDTGIREWMRSRKADAMLSETARDLLQAGKKRDRSSPALFDGEVDDWKCVSGSARLPGLRVPSRGPALRGS